MLQAGSGKAWKLYEKAAGRGRLLRARHKAQEKRLHGEAGEKPEPNPKILIKTIN